MINFDRIIRNKARHFVYIEGNRYSFYMGNMHVATVVSDDMTPEWLEEYRKNHQHLLKDLSPEPDPA